MPRYFFHLLTAGETFRDVDGAELPSLDAALEEALGTARDMLSEAIRFQKQDLPDTIVITDRQERELRRVTLAEVLPPSLKPPK